MRLKVLEAGGRRCALCGATHKDRILHVDHIVPSSKKGPSTFENLQILCSKCNTSKGNRSQRDFRVAEPEAPGYQDCKACDFAPLTEFPSENKLAKVVWSKHNDRKELWIMPKRHVNEYLRLTSQEVMAMHDIMRVALGYLPSEGKNKVEFRVEGSHILWSISLV